MARKKRGFGASWLLLLLGFIAGAGAVILFFRYMEPGEPARTPAPPVKPPAASVPAVPEAPAVSPEAGAPAPLPEALKPPAGPRLAIIIDDMGPDVRKLRELLAVGGPVTVAVMPHMRDSAEISALAASKGLDVIVHMPMEPREMMEHNPGGGALMVAMSPEEIRSKVEDNLRTVPGAIGINNHMGSKFTEDEPRMREVLKVVKKKELLFVDSRTSSKSVAGRVARELGVPSADRNVFLDNTRDVEYIKGQLREAARAARRGGSAIAIGHPYPETIRALREAVPSLAAEGVEVVGVSEIVDHR